MNVLNSFIGTFSDDLSQWRILECMIYLKQQRIERCLIVLYLKKSLIMIVSCPFEMLTKLKFVKKEYLDK